MPERERVSLSADEYLAFSSLVDRLTYAEQRFHVSTALAQVKHPLSLTVMDGFQRQARTMWRTPVGA